LQKKAYGTLTQSDKKFNERYTNYWRSATSGTSKESGIPTIQDVGYYLEWLDFSGFQSCLDLGSGFGRLYPVLSNIAQDIKAVDVEPFALSECAKLGYSEVFLGSAENVNELEVNAEFVFSWGVWDTVDMNKALKAVFDVCGQEFLFTGKSADPLVDDKNGLLSEKMAFFNGHPSKYTDLMLFREYLGFYGFEIERLLLFKHRGDMAKRCFVVADLSQELIPGAYEYMASVKVATKPYPGNAPPQLWMEHTRTMSNIANSFGYSSPADFMADEKFDIFLGGIV
jgi:SAM-dependent methyltransferase